MQEHFMLTLLWLTAARRRFQAASSNISFYSSVLKHFPDSLAVSLLAVSQNITTKVHSQRLTVRIRNAERSIRDKSEYKAENELRRQACSKRSCNQIPCKMWLKSVEDKYYSYERIIKISKHVFTIYELVYGMNADLDMGDISFNLYTLTYKDT